MTFDYDAFAKRAESLGMRDYELAAKELAAIIAARGGAIECAPLLARTRTADKVMDELDKQATHRQCRITFPRLIRGETVFPECSHVCEYSAGSAVSIAWAEKHGSSLLRHDIKAAKENPRWKTLVAFEPLMKRIRAAWNPSLYDVVSSLLMDAPDTCTTFEDWAYEYGYDADSRSAESIFRLCVDGGKFCRLAFGPDFETARALANML